MPNNMIKVLCPVSKKLEWGNVSGKDQTRNPRCTKCGELHPPVGK
jgi:hypothetical protein